MGILADRVKQKYPEYQNVPDDVLEQKVAEKYPEYRKYIKGQNPLQQAANFIAPKLTGVAGAAANVGGMVGDYAKYNLSSDPTAKYEAAKSFSDRTKKSNEYFGNMGFATTPDRQFSPEKYAVGIAQPALEAGSFMAPVGRTLGGAAKFGALSGAMYGASQMKDEGDIAKVGTGALGGTIGGPVALGAGKVLTLVGNKAPNVFAKIGKVSEGVGEDLSIRSLKPTKTQLNKFEEITGSTLKEYQKNMGFYGSPKDVLSVVDEYIAQKQKAYNNLVRTGKKVDISMYVKDLQNTAREILRNDRSAAARQVAEKLKEEAILQQKLGYITDTVLTNTKASQFGGVPGSQMVDPTSYHVGKQTGKAAINTLERYAPGSKQLGVELKNARAFHDIVKEQSNLSKGTQIYNVTKPAFGGFITGAAGGSFVPVVGPAVGGLMGAALMTVANSPSVMGRVGNAALNAGRSMQSQSLRTLPRVPDLVGDVAQRGIRAGFSSLPKTNQSKQERQYTIQAPAKAAKTNPYPSIIPSPTQNVTQRLAVPPPQRTIQKPPELPKIKVGGNAAFGIPMKLKRSSAY